MACTHFPIAARLIPPKISQAVHREECTECFDSQDMPQGIDVCLHCFNGGCVDEQDGHGAEGGRHHARIHFEKTGHQLAVNIRRVRKPRPQTDNDEPPLKRLAIGEEREEDQYDFIRTVRCWGCGGKLLPDAISNLRVAAIVDGISESMSSARQSEVKAWEEEITACEHTLTLHQTPPSAIPPSGLAHCSKCDLTENLWLCLACGSLGCGRKQHGGVGGNGHGLEHYLETKHPVSVKLGTITPEGSADIFCYDCDESRLDPELAFHLANFGINVAIQTKTQKTLTELQIEQNLHFDFSLTDERGRALEPVFGKGLTGLANLGNSCYLASTVQALFALPQFQNRYLPSAELHAMLCPVKDPSQCLDCQMHKLADGLLSGRYSKPASHQTPPPVSSDLNTISDDAMPAPTFQAGLKPSMFKALIGKSHPEFSTMRQQDASEFLTYLLQLLRRDGQRKSVDASMEPPHIFEFGTEQRLQCKKCNGVRYRVDENEIVGINVPVRETGKMTEDAKIVYESVTLEECLEALHEEEEIDYRCPRCKTEAQAVTQTSFASFPDVLVISPKKFQLVNWVPQKLDVPLIVPIDGTLVLDKYLGTGQQEGEDLLPEDALEGATLPEFNATAMSQLEGMGFPTVRCQKALLATGNSDAETAMQWLFEHMEDPDIDELIALGSATASTGPEASPEQISMLSDMGFTQAQAKKALHETAGNMERAVEWLFSHPEADDDAVVEEHVPAPAKPIPGSTVLPAKYTLKALISHKGPSVHSGHYVAHIKEPELGWVLFNDEKVVKADQESVESLGKLAYLYVFEKAL
ncbi:ubiquitin carboxyl-terminal hydrolase 14 [Dacryopinax primogenitus]|uniref:Ubiquitin carboxyl-terminal hydrolase n=1 Tax=Dacryopinax primogenitus (strain DJM 731) TaxID=1858805 RepID=M5GF25_DACPD|nr:ubiquitin carboxyl-terminal hydrolase 14 [Dacryopinax primogenitus]EJU05917.1 ubiquitin carboxyl-terminal hydrolase 14 [Dacryopinax primogenitus]